MEDFRARWLAFLRQVPPAILREHFRGQLQLGIEQKIPLGFPGTGICPDWALFFRAYELYHAWLMSMGVTGWEKCMLSEMFTPWPVEYKDRKGLKERFAFPTSPTLSQGLAFFCSKMTRNTIHWLLCNADTASCALRAYAEAYALTASMRHAPARP